MVTDPANVYGFGIESPNGDGQTREDRRFGVTTMGVKVTVTGLGSLKRRFAGTRRAVALAKRDLRREADGAAERMTRAGGHDKGDLAASIAATPTAGGVVLTAKPHFAGQGRKLWWAANPQRIVREVADRTEARIEAAGIPVARDPSPDWIRTSTGKRKRRRPPAFGTNGAKS